MRIKGQSAKAFSGQNLPVTYVIDKSGKILLHSTGDTKKEKFSMSKFLLETANKKSIMYLARLLVIKTEFEPLTLIKERSL
jgi:hypothetical protein